MGIYNYRSARPEGLADFDWEVLGNETVRAMEFFVEEGEIWDWITSSDTDDAPEFATVWDKRPSGSLVSNCSIEKDFLIFEFASTGEDIIPERAWPVVHAALDKYLDNWFTNGEQDRRIEILDELKAEYSGPVISQDW